MGPIGVPELIFIFILALLIFGPRKLPELGRTFGKALGEFRRASSELRNAVEEEMREMERQAAELKRQAEEAVLPSLAPDGAEPRDADTVAHSIQPPATASGEAARPPVPPALRPAEGSEVEGDEFTHGQDKLA